MMHKVWCSIEEVPYYFSGSSIKFRGHTGWKIDSNPIWVRLLGRSQLSNPSDLPCSIIAHPVNSDLHTWERSLKCYDKNSTYIYIYMMLLIIYMDFLYQFNLGLIAPLFSYFSWKVWKKKFFKIIKSWQVCDWLAKWIIMLQLMDLRWPRVFQRSNVGLVKCFRDVLMYVLERYINKDYYYY